MVRRVIGIIFCVTAFMALFVRMSDPRIASRHGGETLAQFLFELGIGVTLIIFGNRFLSLRARIVAAAAGHLQGRGSVDTAQIANEVGLSEKRVRRILRRSGFAAQVAAP